VESEAGHGSTFHFLARFGFPLRVTEHARAVGPVEDRAIR
jgi:hypothetical protein